MDPAVLCARPQSDTPRQEYNAQLVSNHGNHFMSVKLSLRLGPR